MYYLKIVSYKYFFVMSLFFIECNNFSSANNFRIERDHFLFKKIMLQLLQTDTQKDRVRSVLSYRPNSRI